MKTFHHICIQTNSYEQSLKFYLNVLEFKLLKESQNFHGRAYNTWMNMGDIMIELQTPKNNDVCNTFNRNSEGIVHFCLHTDDFTREYERISTHENVSFLDKDGEHIYRIENGCLFKLRAPEGTIIEVRENWNPFIEKQSDWRRR